MEKVILSMEQEEQYLKAIALYPKEEEMLERHAKSKLMTGLRWGEGFKSLQDISLLDMSSIIKGDYEVEKTAEERFNEKYKKYKDSNLSFDQGFTCGLEWTAKLFNLKVDSVRK